MDFRIALFGFAAPESLLIGFSVRSLGTLSKLSVLSPLRSPDLQLLGVSVTREREGEMEFFVFM